MAMLRFCKAIRPAAGFAVDEAPTHSKHTAELFAMVLDNGRILDEVTCVSWVVTIHETMEAEFSLGELYEGVVHQDAAAVA
jgi:hypothetical protein